jgi:hypothetical protein
LQNALVETFGVWRKIGHLYGGCLISSDGSIFGGYNEVLSPGIFTKIMNALECRTLTAA